MSHSILSALPVTMDFVQNLDPFKLLLGGTVCHIHGNADCPLS